MKYFLIYRQMHWIKRKLRLCADISLSSIYLKNICVMGPLVRLVRRVVNIRMLSKNESEKKLHEVTLQDKNLTCIFVCNYKNNLLKRFYKEDSVSTNTYWHVSVASDIRFDCCTNCHQVRSLRGELSQT